MHSDVNSEGLTFTEWIQAAGYYKPWPGYGDSENTSCAPYSSSTSYFVGYDRDGNEKPLGVNLHVNGGRAVRKTSTRTYFPRKLRQAWRNGEDPSDYLNDAPKRRPAAD